MTKSYRFIQVDVFTDRPFGGNQLAVFTDGRGLSADEMQILARELPNDELVRFGIWALGVGISR